MKTGIINSDQASSIMQTAGRLNEASKANKAKAAQAAQAQNITDVKNKDTKNAGASAIRSRDEYIPSEDSTESIGIYSMDSDEEGNPQIKFDPPPDKSRMPDEKDNKKADKSRIPGKKDDKDEKSESCTGNTDRVDAEIKRLKEKQKKIQQKLNQCGNDTDIKKKKELERELEKVQNELARKDNDSYRRSHSVFRDA